MKQFVLPEDVAKALLSYLSMQPYRDVMQLIVALQQMQELPGDAEQEIQE